MGGGGGGVLCKSGIDISFFSLSSRSSWLSRKSLYSPQEIRPFAPRISLILSIKLLNRRLRYFWHEFVICFFPLLGNGF